MGRGRAPCCAKVGLNRGSWTPEEDMRLMDYIQKYGHGNWRALPKLAGLLRCGKSCRLRWINYLRPDIKRGNFSKEEEDTIIKLHGLLGNKWSKIASCLPGRTDNEIKNVWNTHLKKRLSPKVDQRKSTEVAQPSSPSSISSASASCSDEGSSRKAEEKRAETDKIVIPIEPILDLWDMPEIPIEPEIWNLLDDDLSSIAATNEAESSAGDESERWLQCLEKELDIWAESSAAVTMADVEGGDPVASYFHALPSSPAPSDLLY